GLVAESQRRWDEAGAYYTNAAEIDRAAGARLNEANAVRGLGRVQGALGKESEAAGSFGRALHLVVGMQGRPGQGGVLLELAKLAWRQKKLDEAQRGFARAAEIFSKLPDRPGEANARANLGDVEMRMGNPTAAVAAYTRAVDLYRELGDGTAVL